MKTRIDKKKKSGKEFRRLLLTELNWAREELLGRGESCSEDEAIHLFRKHCKRIRALLRLAQPSLGKRFGKERRRVAKMAREYSEVRDRVVIGDTLRVMGVATRGETADVRAHSSRMDQMKKTAKRLKQMRRRLKKRDYSKLSGRMLWLALSENREKLISQWKKVIRRPSDERLHELRRLAQSYKHQLCSLMGRKMKGGGRAKRRLSKMIDAIGIAHDLQILRERLQPSRNFKALRRAAEAAELRRVETAFQQGNRIFALKDGTLPRGMKKWLLERK